jgi:two-component system, cell cycle sensor histidine kinase and response regulator CckA
LRGTEAAAKEFDMLDYVPIGMCVLRQDYIVLFWNNCLEEWTGIHRDKILGTNIITHFPHLNTPKYRSRLDDIFEGGPPTIFSSQLHKNIFPSLVENSKLRVQHTTVTTVKAADDSGFHALFAVQDVSDLTHLIQGYRSMRDQALLEVIERKRTEQELLKVHAGLEIRIRERTADLVALNEKLQKEIVERKRAEEELRKLISTLNILVEHMPEGVALLDSDHRIILTNQTGEKNLKLISGVKAGDILKDISGHALENFLISQPDKTYHELNIDSPSNCIFELAARTIVQNDIVSGMVLVLKDVTEERKYEERMHSHARLASVGQLAAGIAHDFNNILTGIIGLADNLLTDYSLPAEEKQMVEQMLQSGLRASQLISQILDFSRKSISEITSFNLIPFFNDFLKFVRRTIPENIDISVECNHDELFVRADPSKLQQVLANLTLNASDAMPEGGSLKFTMSRMNIGDGDNSPIPEKLHGEWIVLEVADTGTGIQYEILPHIFEPFFTTKEVGKGTGLGLSQVYGIIKQHDGHIELKTEPGKGCSFKIYLPTSKPKTETASPVEQNNMPKGQSETILVVEDNETICNLVKRKLSKLNYNVITATNGLDALKIYEDRQDEIKLVITDLVMPGMGGLELSKNLMSKTPPVKIIAMTGYPLGSKRKDLTDAGIIECIQKPFSSRVLVQAISNALGKN